MSALLCIVTVVATEQFASTAGTLADLPSRIAGAQCLLPRVPKSQNNDRILRLRGGHQGTKCIVLVIGEPLVERT